MDTVTELFSNRLRKLRGEKSLQSVANDLGISRVSLGYYESGERKPDIEILARICRYFNVTSDYLLGNTDFKTSEKTDIGEKTGLSEYAIDMLQYWKELSDSEKENNCELRGAILLKSLSALISSESFIEFMESITAYICVRENEVATITTYTDGSQPKSTKRFGSKELENIQMLTIQHLLPKLKSDILNERIKKPGEIFWADSKNSKHRNS